MKRGFSALLPLGLFCLTLSACGMSAGGKAIISSGRGGNPVQDVNGKVMPDAVDTDHHLYAMHELMRVFQSSSVLLTGQDQPDIDVGCVQYKKTNIPQKESKQLFRTASYKDCSWQQTFGGQPFSWKIDTSSGDGEKFFLSTAALFSHATLAMRASPLSYLSDAAKPSSPTFGFGSGYTRWVTISRPTSTQLNRFSFKAGTILGEKRQAARDYWETAFEGDWLFDGGKLKSDNLQIKFAYLQAKVKSQTKSSQFSFHSSGVSFDDSKCKRPLGTFTWTSLDAQNNPITNGQFEAKSDGLHAAPPSTDVIPWPKSCLEFPTPATP